MHGEFLLDTNIVVAYFNREDAIRQRLAGIAAFVSSITPGELYFGAYKSTRRASNLKQIQDFIAISNLLVCDQNTAALYGQMKDLLRIKGRLIPENAIWIAAVTRQHNLTLVTRDQHFGAVEGLPVET